jgi:hypothetical protein
MGRRRDRRHPRAAHLGPNPHPTPACARARRRRRTRPRYGGWIAPRRGFLFPVKALSKVFRGKFLDALAIRFVQDALRCKGSTATLTVPAARAAFLARLRATPWVVYAKHTLGHPEQLLDYLGRYVQRVAISNERLLGLDEGVVRFAYRDRARGNHRKTMSLPATQFLKRFLLHVLPSGFTRIRHYGLLANRHKRERLAQVRTALNLSSPPPAPVESVETFCQRVLGIDIHRCPLCRIGTLHLIGALAPQLTHRARPP